MATVRSWRNIPRKTLTAVASPLSATPIYCQEFTVLGLSANSGDFYLGGPTVSATDSVPRAKASPHNFYPVDVTGEPKGWDLSKVYVLGTAGDIVVCQYVSFEDN